MDYLRKPKIIQAMQFTGDNAMEIFRWSTYLVTLAPNKGNMLKMDTKYGTGFAAPGMWVIRGSCGLYYPASDKEFQENYELVSENNNNNGEVSNGRNSKIKSCG